LRSKVNEDVSCFPVLDWGQVAAMNSPLAELIASAAAPASGALDVGCEGEDYALKLQDSRYWDWPW
jgi:hypothetical protein